MVFAVDYDETISEDPDLFRDIISLMKTHGHDVYIVTQNWRKDRPDIVEYAGDVGVEVLFARANPKYKFCGLRGVHVDVWIDDDPRGILT